MLCVCCCWCAAEVACGLAKVIDGKSAESESKGKAAVEQKKLSGIMGIFCAIYAATV